MLAEQDVVDVRCGARLEYRDHFTLRPVQRAHAALALHPAADVLQLCVDLAGVEQGLQTAPVHEDKMDRAVDGMLDHPGAGRAEEAVELGVTHLARRHHELAVLVLAQPGDMP